MDYLCYSNYNHVELSNDWVAPCSLQLTAMKSERTTKVIVNLSYRYFCKKNKTISLLSLPFVTHICTFYFFLNPICKFDQVQGKKWHVLNTKYLSGLNLHLGVSGCSVMGHLGKEKANWKLFFVNDQRFSSLPLFFSVTQLILLWTRFLIDC